MYSVVLAAMLTASPTVAPAWGHGCFGCCCGGWSSCCCGGWSSCCGGGWYGGYSCCCGGWSSCCCGGWYGGYSCCCGGWYPSCCCGGWYPSCCCGGWYGYYGGYYGGWGMAPAYAAPTYAVVAPTPQGTSSSPATVVVKAPLDAGIMVNGQSIDHTKTEQIFTTPDLTPGQSYAYDFRVEVVRDGKTVTRNQKVTVQAGRQSRADFSELSRDDAPARVTIKAPADARVTVDDVDVPPSSRSFETAPLENGRTYYYIVKAEMVRNGKGVSESKRVTLEAGKEASVEFKEPSVATAER